MKRKRKHPTEAQQAKQALLALKGPVARSVIEIKLERRFRPYTTKGLRRPASALLVSRCSVTHQNGLVREHRFSPPLLAQVSHHLNPIPDHDGDWLVGVAVVPFDVGRDVPWNHTHSMFRGGGRFFVPADYDKFGYVVPTSWWRPESAAMRRKRLRDARAKGKP